MGPAPKPGEPAPPFWMQLVPLGLLVVVFYFAMIRPQQKKARQHSELLKAVKAGDRVLTTGGVIGVVITVKEKSLSIRSADSKMEITKSAVAQILTGEASES
jgi:preprotein translocase subunit YajC